jgi:glycosyltransferase involved in cell wall biosynthesis
LVTVVIPAYNAAATINETLLSVRAQTYQKLEVIVVDDGSSDTTADIVERHARADCRVRLIRQSNAGVAAARNAAIAAGSGDFIAPVDADDLWHAQKIEMQVAAMHRGGLRVGLVYTWFALIDERSLVTMFATPYANAGNVLRSLCEFNMVGSGSNPLMRATAVKQAGGYDTTLVKRNAQGCEDLGLYLAIAEHFEFAVVPEYLTGYRRLPTNMSSDVPQMWRSYRLVVDALRQRRPDLRRGLRQGMANMCYSGYRRATSAGQACEARDCLRRLILTMPYYALKIFFYRPLRQAFRTAPAPRITGVGLKFPTDGPPLQAAEIL